MKTWLDRLCEPLEHPKYPQVRHQLVKYEYPSDPTSKILGKCAEGEIACQNNVILRHNAVTLHKEEFLALGVPSDLLDAIGISIRINNDHIIGQNDSIGGFIVGLNDSGYSYDVISEFLRTTFEDAV